MELVFEFSLCSSLGSDLHWAHLSRLPAGPGDDALGHHAASLSGGTELAVWLMRLLFQDLGLNLGEVLVAQW